jgi:hypothetical protein
MALVNLGLQMSGYTNFFLSCVLWSVAGALALWGARPWLAELWPKTIAATGGQLAKREPDSQSAPTPAVPKFERDVWLGDAIWRAYLGIWHIPLGEGILELNVSESEKQRFAMLVIREFRQIAFEGKLPIWGWKGDSTLWEEVPRDFWSKNHIEYIAVATNVPQDEIKAQADNPYKSDTSQEWHHFMTSKAAIEQLYPGLQ